MKSLLTVLLVLLLAVQAEAQKTKLSPEERKAMIQEKRAARKAEGAGGEAKKRGGGAGRKKDAEAGGAASKKAVAETSEVQGSLRVSIVTIPDSISSSFEKLNKQIVLGTPVKKSGKCPLVISLHGSGGANQEISFFAKSSGIKNFSSPPINKYGAKIIVPQSGKVWTPKDLDKMLDYVLETNDDIDVNRIYCVGYSMGGKGTWEWAMHSPKRFAAIMPKAFIPDLANIKEMVDLPIWALVGSDDQKERAEGIPAMEKALKALGSKVVRSTVFPGANHGSAGGEIKNIQAELYEWLFSHSLEK